MPAIPRREFVRFTMAAASLLPSGVLAACGTGRASVAGSASQAGASSGSSTLTSMRSALTSAPATSASSPTTSTIATGTAGAASAAASSASAVTGASGGPVTLTTLHLWPADFSAIQQQFDKMFEQQHPEVKISASNEAFSSATTSKLLALAAAGSLPDVIRAHPNYEVRFAASGLWLDLVPYVARTKDFNLQGDFLPVSLQYHQKQGKLNAIPFTAGTYVLYFNQDLFDRAGLQYPTAQWTYTGDFFNAVQTLTQRHATSPSIGWSGQMPGMDVWSDPVFLHPWGGALLNDTETACLFDQQASRDALTWWLDLKNKYQFTPQATDKGFSFTTGQVAMMYQLPLALITLQRAKPAFRWDVAQLPKGPATSSTGIGAGGYGISAGSKQRDAAWTYLDAYTSTAGLTFMFADTGQDLPARRSAWPAFLKRPGNPAHVQAFFDAGAHAITLRPFGAEAPDVLSKAGPIWADAVSGKRDVPTVTADVTRVVTSVLQSESSDLA